MFKKKQVSASSDGRASDAADTKRNVAASERPVSDAATKPTPEELAAQVDADEAAAAKDEPISQDDHGQWMTPPRSGRTRVTRQQAQAIVRQRIGMRRPTLTERIEFQAEYEVIADEPLPLPTSPTHHAEVLAERASRAAVVIVPPNPIRTRIVVAAKVLLGVQVSKLSRATEFSPVW